MKRIIALCLSFGLIFAVTGCKKKSAQDIEQQITKQMADSKYADVHITGDISMNIPDAGSQKITIDTDLKTDISGNFPKIGMNGSIGVAGVVTLPLNFYMDNDKLAINMLGQYSEAPIPDDVKEQIKSAMNQNSGVQLALNKTVTITKYNNQDALEIVFDTTQLNQLINSPLFNPSAGSENVSIDKLQAYYLLKNGEELDSVVVQMTMTSGTEKIDMNFTAIYNSIGQPVEITPPASTQIQQQMSLENLSAKMAS